MVKQNAKPNASMIASCGSEDFCLEHECQSEAEAFIAFTTVEDRERRCRRRTIAVTWGALVRPWQPGADGRRQQGADAAELQGVSGEARASPGIRSR